MGSLLYIIAFALMMAWALSYYFFGSEPIVHILLFLTAAVLVYEILRKKRKR